VLGRGWEPATAKIVAKSYKDESGYTGTWKYVADITPSSGVPFRAELKQPHLMSHVVNLEEGDVVKAFADVGKKKAKFDRSDPNVSGKGKPSSKDSFKEALAEPPGSPAPGKTDVTAEGAGGERDDDRWSGEADRREDY
jgi:hypothetical protein